MERVDKINLDRLMWCCNEADIDLHNLFNQLKISETKADQLINGESGVLSFNQLAKIGDYFDRGMLFFYEDGDVEEEALLTPQYRTIQNQKPDVSFVVKKLIRQVEKHREIYLGLIEDLGLDIPVKVAYPEMPQGATFKTKAAILRQWLGLSDTNTFTTYRRAVEDKGILVIVTQGYAGKWQIPKNNKIRGFALFRNELPVIVVRKLSDNPEAQSFTLMHELAHLVLHQDSFIDDEDDLHATTGREKEANMVAGYVLVPDDFLKPFDKHELSQLEISEFKGFFKDQVKQWAVSVDVVLIRLVNVQKLAYAAYDAYYKWNRNKAAKSSSTQPIPRAYRNREPVHILGKPYVGAVLTALSENIITLTKASDYLDNIGLSNIHKLKESYARM